MATDQVVHPRRIQSIMAQSSCASSPDPLGLPSSPLAPLQRRSNKSPAKSPTSHHGNSKETIVSPSKRRAAGISNLSSPAKRLRSHAPDIRWEVEVKRPSRRTSTAPTIQSPRAQQSRPSNAIHSSNAHSGYDDRPSLQRSIDGLLSARPKSNAYPQQTHRSHQLNKARQDFNLALQDAVGKPKHLSAPSGFYKDPEGRGCDDTQPGDMTVSMNEDFTMVSVETLQSYRNRPATGFSFTRLTPRPRSVIEADSEIPSSPPQEEIKLVPGEIDYPNLEKAPAQDYTKRPFASDDDAMSWRPTGRARNFDSIRNETAHTKDNPMKDSQAKDGQNKAISESAEWHLARQAVSQQIEHADADEVIVINDEETSDNDEDGDIWQEEASRSHEDDLIEGGEENTDEQQTSNTEDRKERLEDLFVDQPLKPQRSKIPRTWRRVSGNDFSYVDSPQHTYAAGNPLESHPNPVDETAQDGVLTPPTSDDEDKVESPSASNKVEEHSHDNISNVSPSSSTSSKGEDDTGLFWQTNMPNLFQKRPQRPRPPRKSAVDLSDLLDPISSRPNSARRPQPQPLVQSSRIQRSNCPQKSIHRALGQAGQSSPMADSSMLSSPLRRSLLKSSKLKNGTGPVQINDNSVLSIDFDDSMASKASDQRQVIQEMRRAQSHGPTSGCQQEPSQSQSSSTKANDHREPFANENDASDQFFPSYEEQLNIDSPQKVRVNFNDSEHSTSLEERTPSQSLILSNSPPPQPSLLSRLTTSFWSAVIRPTGPTEVFPHTPPPPPYDARLRARLRRRYGVLPNQHPWTMTHMRTLHRMLNSCTSNRYDSIIPTTTGPTAVLDADLAAAINTRHTSVAGTRYRLTMQHAHVVAALLQVLVEPTLVAAMEQGEIEFLGDSAARQARDVDPLGRRGKDPVWMAYPKIVVPAPGRAIGWEFVVAALGDVVETNRVGRRVE